jgi:hypothetical protein
MVPSVGELDASFKQGIQALQFDGKNATDFVFRGVLV